MTETVEDRFWAKVDRSAGPNACWLWLAGDNGKMGYGLFKFGNRGQWLAHRAAYTIVIGEIPTGKILRHSCDTPKCCNPNHLVPGTHKDNVDDKVRRGRAPRGANHKSSKLKEHEVLEIRGSTFSAGKLARKFNVADTTVLRVKSRQRWTHLP